jgi:hypothetical protein
MRSFSALAVLAALLSPALAASVHRDGPRARAHHHGHAPNAASVQERAADVAAEAPANATALVKRAQFSNTRFTFFGAGIGACGQTFSDSDFVSASVQFFGWRLIISLSLRSSL